MTTYNNLIISTDLDGTLLDHHNYDYSAAIPVVRALQIKGVPIIFNTSKTLAEVLDIQDEMGIYGPCVVENGSAMYFEDKFYQSLLLSEQDHVEPCNLGWKVCFGETRDNILRFLSQQQRDFDVQLESYRDFSAARLMELTGLSPELAQKSAAKRFSEPFIWLGDSQQFADFEARAVAAGLKILKGGRFYHLQGNTDKGVPLRWLRDRLRYSPRIICLGDSNNDVDMLNNADVAICVRSPVGDYPSLRSTVDTIHTHAYGPNGWAEAVHQILEN